MPRLLQKLRRNIERNLFGRDPYYHDPYDDPAEQFYARLYLKHLLKVVREEFGGQGLRILDLGCHTGRISVPLAQAGHEVTGIDSSRFHAKRAEMHAREAGVNAQFLKADGFRFVREAPRESFDLVLCTEVLYQRRDFFTDLLDLMRLVKVGGLLATSHRTRFLYLSLALARRDFETAHFILGNNQGELWGSYFNWQRPEELKHLYQRLGAELRSVRPVGALSGNGEEGMARLCNVGTMSEEERKNLLEIEGHDSEEFAEIARYLFVIGKKIKP